jgi:HAD superfamily hydrolase (TIGR01490 family)
MSVHESIHQRSIEHPDNGTRAAGAAFFDVDETVIRVKSMFEFLRYWLARNGDDGSAYRTTQAEFRQLADSGVDRTEINRKYYQRFAGVEHRSLVDAGRDWYIQYRAQPTAFVTSVIGAIEAHRAAGDRIVLVSGSFRPVLDPLATDIRADLVLCTEPLVADDGRLTGAVVRPMIGDNKADAVGATISALGFTPAECFCYGDHASDLGMLSLVGNPRVVGADPVLTEYAQRLGWPVLPATTGPRAEIRVPR